MVRLAIVYPDGEGKCFDLNYYIERHMAGARQMLAQYGLTRVEVDRPLAPGPIACIGYFYFETLDGLQRGMEAQGPALIADVPNYTDIAPQLYTGEITEVMPV